MLSAGSLVLGQNQECYGACFSPSQSLDGSMAAVRVWNRVRTHVSLVAFSVTSSISHLLSVWASPYVLQLLLLMQPQLI